MGLSQNQRLFAGALSSATGLSPEAIGAWMMAEEPSGNATTRGDQNWLNIGQFDSGPGAVAHGIQSIKTPQGAAAQTAKFLRGEWGGASQSIRGILSTKGQSAAAQLAAIANSDWASSHYGGASHLQSLLKQVGVVSTAGGGPIPQVLPKSPLQPDPKPLPYIASTQVAGPNIYTTLSGLEAARQVVSGDTSGVPDPIQSTWNTLAAVIAPSLAAQPGTHLSAPIADKIVLNKATLDAAHGPASAKKILSLAQQAVGGPYSQAHHASAFTASAAQLRATGTDCSGFISWLMGPDGLNIWKNALTTVSIPTAPGIQRGIGRSITIWNNPLPGNSGHVFIDILGNFFQSAGGGTGIQRISGPAAQRMIKNGDGGSPYYALHPRGL